MKIFVAHKRNTRNKEIAMIRIITLVAAIITVVFPIAITFTSSTAWALIPYQCADSKKDQKCLARCLFKDQATQAGCCTNCRMASTTPSVTTTTPPPPVTTTTTPPPPPPPQPPEKHKCWDDSLVDNPSDCPRKLPGTKTKKCWNGTLVLINAKCPDKPRVSKGFECTEPNQKPNKVDGKCVCQNDSEHWPPCDGPCVKKCDPKKERRNEKGECESIECEEKVCEPTECEEKVCEDPCPAAKAVLEEHHTLLKYLTGLCCLILAIVVAILLGGKEWIEKKRKERAAKKRREKARKRKDTKDEEVHVIEVAETEVAPGSPPK